MKISRGNAKKVYRVRSVVNSTITPAPESLKRGDVNYLIGDVISTVGDVSQLLKKLGGKKTVYTPVDIAGYLLKDFEGFGLKVGDVVYSVRNGSANRVPNPEALIPLYGSNSVKDLVAKGQIFVITPQAFDALKANKPAPANIKVVSPVTSPLSVTQSTPDKATSQPSYTNQEILQGINRGSLGDSVSKITQQLRDIVQGNPTDPALLPKTKSLKEIENEILYGGQNIAQPTATKTLTPDGMNINTIILIVLGVVLTVVLVKSNG